jgi:hypothetical protein
MRKAIVSLLFLVAVAAVVIVLRNDLPEPPRPEPVRPSPQPVTRAVADGLPWQQVALPDGTDQVHRSAVDLDQAVFPVQGADGARRIVVRTATAVTEVARSSGATPLVSTLDGPGLVSYAVSDGATHLSSVDVKTGARAETDVGFPAETVAVAGGTAALLSGDKCLHLLDARTLRAESTHCAEPDWAISFLTAEKNAVQWRETRPEEACAVWFHLIDGKAERLDTSERACQTAALVMYADWEITADFPRYELGVLYPGPLVARRGDREVALDTTVLDVHPCGGHVYWLSKPSGSNQQGELARWRPGDTTVEVVKVGTGSGASPPVCVNGVLNVATYGSGPPQLWTLAQP